MTDITPLLDALLNALYQNGFRRFYSGAALGLDTLAAERVLHLRTAHDDVCLSLAIPCADQARSWHEAQQLYREQLIYMADEVNVLSPHYYPSCMMVRNRFMVDRSSLCVC